MHPNADTVGPLPFQMPHQWMRIDSPGEDPNRLKPGEPTPDQSKRSGPGL